MALPEGTNASGATLETIQQSIESLAIATAKGFERVEAKFGLVNDEIVTIKTDIGEMKGDIVNIKNDISGIKQRLSGLDNRLDSFVDHERRLVRVETVLKIQERTA